MVAVFGWFKKKREAPLTAGPVRPRLKTYSAATGHVYQYVFAGQRHHNSAVEYVFDVRPGRSTQVRTRVIVLDEAIQGRNLTSSMRYGVAKLALRNAFDTRTPEAIEKEIAPGADEVREILEELGI